MLHYEDTFFQPDLVKAILQYIQIGYVKDILF